MSEEVQELKKRIVPILEEAGVLRSSLFGSVARGQARSDSDLDLLVDLPANKSLFDLIDLQEQLETALGRKVDIGTYRSIKEALKNRILNEQILIYER